MLKIDLLVSPKDIKAAQLRLSIGVFCSVFYSITIWCSYILIDDGRSPYILLYFISFLLINEYPFTLTFSGSFLNIRYILKLLNRIAERLIVILASRSTEWQLRYLIISYYKRVYIISLIPQPETTGFLIPERQRIVFCCTSRIVRYLGLESIDQCASNS